MTDAPASGLLVAGMAAPRQVGAYALITPTRNNADTIGATLASVTRQTVPPVRWIIVSDGSSDRTEEIVDAWAERHPFIRLIRRSSGEAGGFGSKVKAFNVGLSALRDVPHELVGNLDADVSFAPEYFERLLQAFAEDPSLGVAGGAIVEEVGGQTWPQRISANSVAGAVQLFRRQCFEETGGFVPLPLGGEDSTVEIMARARGWTVRTLFELPVAHQGRVGVRNGRASQARFRKGVTNYLLGYDPLFHAAVSLYRMGDRPYVVGGLSMLCGYGWAALRRPPRAVPEEGVRFLRAEQRRRLAGTLAGRAPVRVAAVDRRK